MGGTQRIEMQTPLLALRKLEIIATGLALRVDYVATISCYDPSPDGASCGHCDACLLRLKGFAANGVDDPARAARLGADVGGPGRGPARVMAPRIVSARAGRVAIITGSPGGSAIIDYVVKMLLAIIDWKLDPQAATALPNFGSRNGPTELEKDTAVAALAPKLRALGHEVRVIRQTSGVQAIVRTRTGWIGGADPRREGVVMGD